MKIFASRAAPRLSAEGATLLHAPSKTPQRPPAAQKRAPSTPPSFCKDANEKSLRPKTQSRLVGSAEPAALPGQPALKLLEIFLSGSGGSLRRLHLTLRPPCVLPCPPSTSQASFLKPAKPHYFLLPFHHKTCLCLCLLPAQTRAWTFYVLTVKDKMCLSCALR